MGTGTFGNAYDGFDRFGRVVDHRWIETAGGTDVDRFEYGYDRASSRIWRSNPLTTGHDEFYSYDDLHRLTSMTRGDLNGTQTGIVSAGATFAQDWDLDPLGNWDGFQQDDNGDGSSGWDLDQTRTHNDVNEITGITGGGWVTPTHDAAGNMTKLPQPDTTGGPTQSFDATYDPWNRLVKLIDSNASQMIAEYAYNGLGCRITQKLYASGVLNESKYEYFSIWWQRLEERSDGTASTNATKQHTWGLRYIDDLVEYDQDDVGNLDQRHYALPGMNYNITSIATTSGAIAERYEYSPYGERLVLDADYSDDVDGISDVGNDIGHQGLMHDEEMGLIQNRLRPRSSRLGRFPNRDPLEYIDGPSMYQFVRSNPLYWLDPFGLAPNKQDSQGGIDKFIEKVEKLEKENPDLNLCEMIDLASDNANNDGTADDLWHYIYTKERGWIDTGHFLEAASWSKGATGDLGVIAGGYYVEISQWINGLFTPWRTGVGSSAFTEEDLPSNEEGSVFGTAYEDICDCPNAPKLSEALRDHLNGLGVLPPEAAPGYNNLPNNEAEHESRWQSWQKAWRELRAIASGKAYMMYAY